MTEILYRDATLEVREDNPDEWVLSGLAVPYGAVTKIGDYRESFESGAFAEVDADLPIYYGHNHLRGEAPIGKITAAAESDKGLSITARISKTVRGTEVYQLLKDGVLRNFSVGFKPVAHKIVDNVVVRTKAALFEVSIVPQPAYSGAVITEVREETSARSADEVNKEKNMTDSVSNADLIEVRNSIEDLSRQWDMLKATATASESADEFQIRSYGEYVKGIAKGDADALAMYRAWTGGTSADSVIKKAWVGDLTKIVEQPRRVINTFQRKPLPAEGLSLEYAKLLSDTTQVGVQANEGDTLLYGKVAVTTANAPVKTVGGYTSMTRQEIDRASVNIVDTAWRALVQKYAQASEAYVRAIVNAAAAHEVADATIATADGWIDFLVDAATHLDSKGKTVDGVLVSGDVFKAAAKLKVGDSYLLDRNQGTVNIPGLSGSVFNVPFTLVSGTDVATVFSKTAVTTYESGGPAQLTDGDITNLTALMSVYGYIAAVVEDADALVVRGA